MVHFGNDDYDAPGKYLRDGLPDHPLRLEDLPEALRRHVDKLRLDVRFAEATEIDLNDHMTDDDVVVYSGESMKPRPPGQEAPRPARSIHLSWRAIAIAVVVAIGIVVAIIMGGR